MEQLFWRKENERCERTERHILPKAPAPLAQAPAPVAQAPAPAPAAQQVIADHGFRQVSNKREEANAKINDRYLIGQANQNPFMLSNNYVNDIEVQLNYLTPQRSSN
jgi:hypothetical protein